jgi:hypothetical protein
MSGQKKAEVRATTDTLCNYSSYGPALPAYQCRIYLKGSSLDTAHNNLPLSVSQMWPLQAQLSLRLIKHHDTKTNGEAEVKLHPF